MTKKKIHQRFVEQLERDLEQVTTAAKHSFEVATHEEHKAESKYDTFSLESSYLARGQAQRVEALRDAVERFRMLPLKKLTAKSPIVLSALIRLKGADGAERVLFFGPSAGGMEIEADGETVMVITSSAPLGKALVGKKEGDSFEIKMGPLPERFTIVSVR